MICQKKINMKVNILFYIFSPFLGDLFKSLFRKILLENTFRKSISKDEFEPSCSKV